jgi:hypothetical protein
LGVLAEQIPLPFNIIAIVRHIRLHDDCGNMLAQLGFGAGYINLDQITDVQQAAASKVGEDLGRNLRAFLRMPADQSFELGDF